VVLQPQRRVIRSAGYQRGWRHRSPEAAAAGKKPLRPHEPISKHHEDNVKQSCATHFGAGTEEAKRCAAKVDLPADASTWTKQETLDWVHNHGFAPSVESQLTKAFIENDVNGAVLLHIENSDLRDDIGIENAIQRRIILTAIKSLTSTCDGNECHAKMDFWEYRSMDRKLMTQLMPALHVSPQYAIYLMDKLPDHGKPEGKCEGLEWLFLPHKYIWENRDQIAGGLPGWIRYMVLIDFIGQLILLITGILLLCAFVWIVVQCFCIQEARGKEAFGVLLVGGLYGVFLFVKSFIIVNIVMIVSLLIWAHVLWPFIPAALCDMLFVACIYLVPFFQVCGILRSIYLFMKNIEIFFLLPKIACGDLGALARLQELGGK